MKRENVAFLIGGFAFGVLFGFALFVAVKDAPQVEAAASGEQTMAGPAGPMAPTQAGPAAAEGGAPMMAEINALKGRLQENPQDVQALTRLANIYHDVAMWDQAVAYYERALEHQSQNPDLITDLGICYRGMRQFDRAIELFDRAQEVKPGHWQSRFNSAVVLGFDLAQFDRALEIVASMESMDSPPPNVAQLRHALEEARAAGAPGG